MNIVVLPGDDIGPEITSATLTVLQAADERFGLGLRPTTHEIGFASLKSEGTTLPGHVLEAARAADGIILGPASMSAYPPLEQGGVNVPGTIRRQLDLYANLRPFRTRPGLPDARAGIDILMARENTEGFYPDRNMFAGRGEFMPTDDVALSVRTITAKASRRIARIACELSRERRGKVTAVHKKHVLQLTDGLFMRAASGVASEYPDVTFADINVDAMASALYESPEQFDVILITNMFGDILSNQAAAMAGGMGLAGGLNVGDTHAAANAAHGSAPDIAGKDVANPSGLIISSAMLLRWLGRRHELASFGKAADAIDAALDATLADPRKRTVDLGGEARTSAFASHVAGAVLGREPGTC